MANWAVVIGIDRYWLPKVSLKGAVNDALAMREWLLKPDGGNVPESNLKLLLSPLPGKEPQIPFTDAASDNILTEIVDLLQRSGEEGERFYFCYAGHGISVRVNSTDETAIVGTNFTDILTSNSCTLRSLTEFFQTTQFRDQFFFVDACWNIPWGGEIVPGYWTRPRPRDPGLDPVQQFIFYATSPGLEALEADERGAFTKLLIAGLQGAETAKAWAPEGDGYVVRWDRLVSFVGDQFDRLRLPAGKGYQRPQQDGARGAANPVLARFAPGSFPEETLKVVLKPAKVAATAEVDVFDEFEPVEAQPKRRAGAITFSLPPKTYGVRAKADAYAPARCRPPVELYGPQEVQMTLAPAPAPGAGVAVTNGGGDAATAEAEPAPPAAVAASAGVGALFVECSDRLAPLELADSSGHVLQVGAGHLDVRNLAAGFYRARMRSPEGDVAEKVVEVRAGEPERVQLEAAAETPSRLVAQMIGKGVVDEHADHTLEASELVGPMASPHLATILTLAGAFAIRGISDGPGEKLRRLGLKAVQQIRGAPAAVYVLAGADLEDPNDASRLVKQIEFRVWPIGQPVATRAQRLHPLAGFPGLGELAVAAPPGPHWLSITFPNEEPLVLAITPLPRRVAFVVLQRKADGRLGVHQYLPSPTDLSSSPEFLRKLEVMQRIYQGGRLDLGMESARELLYGKWSDPIAGCLGGYLMLKLGGAKSLKRAAQNMVRAYPGLSDSHVLQAEYHASQGHRAMAERSAKKALKAGLPIFAQGISHLLDYPAGFRIDEPNARLASHVLDGQVKDSLWSLWSPPELKPGRLLVP